ncbi:MAG: hypothetical protein MK135_16425 [Polyangiaceae bacterium]|nr:hypothetical protein [Polyangiaceae bacterium]
MTEPSAVAPARTIAGTHAVTCGCTLEHVGHCSEYVEVDGQFVELQLPESQDFGPMPFCGKEGIKAKVAGELKNGKVIATSFEIIKG